MWKLKERFQGLVRQSTLKLEFKAGFTWGWEENDTATLLHQVCVAVLEAEKKDAATLSWSEVEDTEAAPKQFGKIVSMEYIEEASFASLALNILDRCSQIEAGLDLISCR